MEALGPDAGQEVTSQLQLSDIDAITLQLMLCGKNLSTLLTEAAPKGKRGSRACLICMEAPVA